MKPQTFTTATGPLLFHLTRVSSNRKTGPIPVSTSSAKTCPPTCPLAANGCYANGGPMALHWREVTNGNRGVVWADFLEAIRNLPKGQLWRHNAAGDLWKPGTVIGSAALTQLVEANRGRRGFTYSHHPRTPSTVRAFKSATAHGFTVNASCHSETEADAAVADGLRAVVIVPAAETRNRWQSPGGNPIVLCPAQRDGERFAAMDCATCQLCAARPQHVVVAFKAHGNGRRKAEATLGAANAP